MSAYKKILLAVDLTDETDQLVEKTREMAQNNQAELYVIHVIEPLSFAYGGDVPFDLSSVENQLEKHANAKLAELEERLAYPVKKSILAVGQTDSEIHEAAEKLGIDLVMIGSHGRHGFSLLLGSTANSVLHGAKCDVLAVRMHEEK